MTHETDAPLAGRRIVVTRAEPQARELIDLFERAGATVLHVPAIRFEPPPSWDSLDLVLESPSSWDWIVFTSANGVAFFVSRMRERGIDPATVSAAKIAAVGAATADALRAHGIEPDVVPARFRATEVLPLLPDNQDGVRTAVVRALEGREELIDALLARGGDVHSAVAYKTQGLESLPDNSRAFFTDGNVDALTFTSPSTAENLLRHFSPGELARLNDRAHFVSIGPTTTDALHSLGIDVVSEADHATMRDLVSTVVRVLRMA